MTENEIDGLIRDDICDALLWGRLGRDTLDAFDTVVGELLELRATVERLAAREPLHDLGCFYCEGDELHSSRPLTEMDLCEGQRVEDFTVVKDASLLVSSDPYGVALYHGSYHEHDCPWLAAKRYVDGGAV